MTTSFDDTTPNDLDYDVLLDTDDDDTAIATPTVVGWFNALDERDFPNTEVNHYYTLYSDDSVKVVTERASNTAYEWQNSHSEDSETTEWRTLDECSEDVKQALLSTPVNAPSNLLLDGLEPIM